MSERRRLLESVVNTVKDYRAGEIAEPTPEHVDRWVMQFGQDAQVPMLREVNHVLKQTYYSRRRVSRFLSRLIMDAKLVGTSPCAFWSKANFLQIQRDGHSQQEMLELFDASLKEQCGINIDNCDRADACIYIDDVIFSGSRVGNDLSSWVENDSPARATVHVIVLAVHALGEYLLDKRLKETVAASGKRIEFTYWRAINIENRKYFKDNSQVLWPIDIPDDPNVRNYVAQPHRFPFEARVPGGNLGPFSSEEGRQLLERELLIAGVKIRNLSQNPKDILRPLGFSAFGLGFGSMMVTFRNCPNNCPLALWWGDPDAISGPFHWYPLFARKTYE